MDGSSQPPARQAAKPVQPLSLNLSIDPTSMSRFLDLIRKALEPEIAKALSQIQAMASVPPSTEPSSPASAPQRGIEWKPADQIKAADLRVALLMGKVPEDTGILIDTRTFARLLNVSPRHVRRLSDEKAVPDPIRLGKAIRWRLAEILEWIEADCPPQKVWAHKRQDSARRKGR